MYVEANDSPELQAGVNREYLAFCLFHMNKAVPLRPCRYQSVYPDPVSVMFECCYKHGFPLKVIPMFVWRA